MNDTELLRQYAQHGSPEAFRELVARHTNLVYACARQRLHDDHAAQDVTQAAFLALAQQAQHLSLRGSLSTWLYGVTRHLCRNHLRREQRRQEREMRAFADHPSTVPGPAHTVWEELEPHLAGALDALSGADREVILLRFYRQASHRQIADQLRISEDAAEKRVSRALERLRGLFARQGVVLSATVLAGVLTANISTAAPAGLAASVAGAALAGNGALQLFTTGGIAIMSTKLKIAAGAAIVCLLAGGTGLYVWQTNPGPAATANNEPSPAVATTPSQSPRPTAVASATTRNTNTTAAPVATVPPPVRPRGQNQYADPKQACATLLLAFQQRDPAALAESIAAPTAERKATFCRILPVMFAMGDLSQACLTRFGETLVDKQVIYLQGESLARWLALVPQALVSMDGAAAKLDFTGIVDSGALERLPLGTVLEFRQVDGAWKLWIAHEPNRKEVRLAEHAERLVPVLQTLTTDVQQGRFATAEEVRRAMEEAAQTVMTNAAPATRHAP